MSNKKNLISSNISADVNSITGLNSTIDTQESINSANTTKKNINSSAKEQKTALPEQNKNLLEDENQLVNINLEEILSLIQINLDAYSLTSTLKDKDENKRQEILQEFQELNAKYHFQCISHDLSSDSESYEKIFNQIEILVLKNKKTNETTLVFPGTQIDKSHAIADISTDINLTIGNHVSYIDNLNKILFELLLNLNLENSKENITIVGHSLGGHYAQVSKMLLAEKDCLNVNLITFDSPGCEKSMKQYCKEKNIDYANLEKKIQIQDKGYTKHYLAEGNNLINQAGGNRLEGEEYSLKNQSNKFASLGDKLKVAYRAIVRILELIQEAQAFNLLPINPIIINSIAKVIKVSKKIFNVTELTANTHSHKLKHLANSSNIKPLNDKAKKASNQQLSIKS